LFKIAVKIQNSKFISATGYSKKDAELKAANLFLKKIGL
jgi:dsRNA-specific ribonuclease